MAGTPVPTFYRSVKRPLLRTNRLILRPPVPEDAPPIQQFVRDRRIAETEERWLLAHEALETAGEAEA